MKRFSTLLLIIFCLGFNQITFGQADKPSKGKKKEKKEKVKKEKTPKVKKEKPPKVKKEKPPKVKKEKTSSSSESSGEGGNKNFGPALDGAFISLSAGTNMYFGDLAAYNLFPRPSQFSDHLTSAFKATMGRDIKWGLGAQLNYQTGSLIGTRKTGKHSSTYSFNNKFYDISLQLNYNLNDVISKKSEFNRFTIYGHIGFGSMWYRTQLYDTYTFGTKDYEGYVEVDNTQSLAQKTLSDNAKRARTWTIPYGVRINYRYNYKMDFHFDFTQTSTFTDRLDAFSRDWTANDKYNYVGIGVTFNFNRSSDDAPKKKAKKEIPDDESTSDNSDNLKNKIFGGKKKRKSSKEDELLNVRLKLFETQLKLFEMQYLLNK
jgi:hypothetical protein